MSSFSDICFWNSFLYKCLLNIPKGLLNLESFRTVSLSYSHGASATAKLGVRFISTLSVSVNIASTVFFSLRHIYFLYVDRKNLETSQLNICIHCSFFPLSDVLHLENKIQLRFYLMLFVFFIFFFIRVTRVRLDLQVLLVPLALLVPAAPLETRAKMDPVALVESR